MMHNIETNKIYCMDAKEGLNLLPDDYIDLTVTSPPYDDLRTYKGYSFDFEPIAKELYRVTKLGGVVVWVVGDATVNGSETGTSFRQALYFRDECGFNLHDTMIYERQPRFPDHKRYNNCFEFMFVFSKGKPKTINRIADKVNLTAGTTRIGASERNPDGSMREMSMSMKGSRIKNKGVRGNIWKYGTGFNQTTKDKDAYKHPAIFPEQLASDHIISWSNEGDLILDPMCGSGTTCKMAMANNRKYIGIDISEEYCEIARKRIADHEQQLTFEAIT